MTSDISANWLVESLRITLFPTPAPYKLEQNWWEYVTGELPDKSTSLPREGSLTQEGNALGEYLILGVLPGRVDWHFRSPDPATAVGELVNVTERFLNALVPWVSEAAPPTQRVAFGAVLRLPADDRITGYQKLFKFLPDLRLNPTSGIRDFSFQINRPRESQTVPGLSLNRLTRWNVAFQQTATFTYQGTPGPLASVQETTHYCRLESDMNTNSEFVGELDRKQVEQLLGELKGLTFEIANKGDIA